MRAAALLALLLTPISAVATTRAQLLMGTVCEIEAERAGGIDRAFAEAARIEEMLSTWRETSELSRLDRAGSATVSPQLAVLLERTMRWRSETGGAFDPLVAPLVAAWKTREAGAVPDARTIARALASMRASNVKIAGNRITLSNGARFEEGAFGKGYAIDAMLAKLEGPATINFGGQIAVRGAREVTIADPRRRDVPVVALRLEDASLSTSSGSEKTFRVGGRTFSHLLDPRTGEALPPRGSASVVAGDALTADILSTALYVMGPEAGLRWADARGVAALFITPDHLLRPSKAFRALGPSVLDGNFKTKD